MLQTKDCESDHQIFFLNFFFMTTRVTLFLSMPILNWWGEGSKMFLLAMLIDYDVPLEIPNSKLVRESSKR